jgi:hypothetical protein
MLLYIGPGIGIATIIVVGIVLLIVAASFIIILWHTIKKWISRIKKVLKGT